MSEDKVSIPNPSLYTAGFSVLLIEAYLSTNQKNLPKNNQE